MCYNTIFQEFIEVGQLCHPALQERQGKGEMGSHPVFSYLIIRLQRWL